MEQGRYAEAETMHQRVLAIREQELGPSRRWLHRSTDLARGIANSGRYAEAEALYKRALAIEEKAVGASHPNVAATAQQSGAGSIAAKPLWGSGAIAQRVLAIREQALGAAHPEVAFTLDDLAILHAALGNIAAALRVFPPGTAAIIAHAASEAAQRRPDRRRRGGLVEQRAHLFSSSHRSISRSLRAAACEPEAALGREGFETAQWATQSAAAAALHQMATRVASGGGALAALVREIQDITGFARVLDEKLLASLANPHGHHDRAPLEVLRQQAERIEGRLAALTAQIEKEFPDYAVLANPSSAQGRRRCRACFPPMRRCCSGSPARRKATCSR